MLFGDLCLIMVLVCCVVVKIGMLGCCFVWVVC